MNKYINYNIYSNKELNKIFKIACKHGYNNVVKLLLADNRVDPSDYDNYARFPKESYNCLKASLSSAIRLASENGHLEIAKLLLIVELIQTSMVIIYPVILIN